MLPKTLATLMRLAEEEKKKEAPPTEVKERDDPAFDESPEESS